MRREFIEACESLVDSDRGKLVIDLTGALSISSMFLGTIADFSQRAAACGKHLAVLAGGRLARLFNQTSLQEIVDVVVVDHAL
jgi:anti-anti-sigma regulatory factor